MDNYISDLLYEYDCVIIPNLGGFVANYASAKIHPNQHIFSPPSKHIVFNKNLKNNDGLLANHIATVENKTYSEALASINDFVDKCLNLLESGKHFEIKNVGKFYFDDEQNIQFERQQDINYLLGSFGMTDFQSPSIKRETVEKKIEKTFKDRPPLKNVVKKTKIKKLIPLLIALPLLALLVFIPLKMNFLKDISVNYSNLNPFADTTQKNIKSENSKQKSETVISDTVRKIEAPVVEEIKSDNTTVSTVSEEIKNISVETKDEKKQKRKKKNQKEKSMKYFVIGGCFSVPENAEKFIKKLKKKGLNPFIVDTANGLTRVGYSGFSKRKDAMDALASIKTNQNESAWLLKK